MILLHAGFASLVLQLGPIILLRPKGGRWHRAVGRLFAGAVLASNLSSFFIYELTGRPSFIHALTVINLASLGHALWAARRRRISDHLTSMTYCYAGFVAAVLVRLDHWLPLPWPYGFAAIVAATFLATAMLLHRFGPASDHD